MSSSTATAEDYIIARSIDPEVGDGDNLPDEVPSRGSSLRPAWALSRPGAFGEATAWSAVLSMLALFAASSAAAAPPRLGVLVPGRSLGGLELGATKAQVRAVWGPRFGSCRGCADPTWYFNFQRFEPQGAGVSFRDRRVTAIFTLWAPRGWRTRGGLRIGDAVTLGTRFVRSNCGTYFAFTTRARMSATTIYSRNGKVWGFGLSRPSVPVCR